MCIVSAAVSAAHRWARVNAALTSASALISCTARIAIVMMKVAAYLTLFLSYVSNIVIWCMWRGSDKNFQWGGGMLYFEQFSNSRKCNHENVAANMVKFG